MKRTTLLLAAMLCISFSLMANINNSGKELNRLMKLLPDNVSTQHVKEIFGEATIITINNKTGEEYWQYKNDDEDIYFRWDMKTNKLKNLSYNSHEKQKQNWENHYLALLEMGTTSMKDAINILGNPASMYLQSSGNSLRYTYADITLQLQFKKGVLSSINVSTNEKKEGTTITIE